MVTSAGRFAGCTALAALALLYVECRGWHTDTQYRGAAHSTRVGEVQHLLLDEGIQVDLNTDSDMRARVEDNRRVAVLNRGEARFRVDPNARVTFLVMVGTARVQTTGADFSVRRINNSAVDVLVKNGHVDIRIPAPEPAFPAFRSSPLLALTATFGESISLRANSVYARERLCADILERRTAWTDGWLWFSAEPLPQALAQFNRYHEQQLVLVDRRLASLRVGGRFRSADLDSFIAALEHSFDVQIASALLPGARVPTIYLSERCSRALQQCN